MTIWLQLNNNERVICITLRWFGARVLVELANNDLVKDRSKKNKEHNINLNLKPLSPKEIKNNVIEHY